VKAMLIASATDVPLAAEKVPGADQGWGRIALAKVMYFSQNSQGLWLCDKTEGFADSNDPPFDISLNVNSGTPFKVTLTWSDYPALVGVSPSLVNDLDLSVHTPEGDYWGNHLAAGSSIPGGEPDNLNNVEVVLIDSPVGGAYQVRVMPFTLPEPPQGFAIVLTGDFNTTNTAGATHWMAY
jgi:hypothetical protein